MNPNAMTTSPTGGSHGNKEGFHYVTVTLPGDVETVRSRLALAMKRVGYEVVSERPLEARHPGLRRPRKSGSVLDHPRSLIIRFEPGGGQMTVATFDYHMTMTDTRGNKLTLTREVEAIAAFCRAGSGSPLCPGCGTDNPSESHFCRRCGTPLSSPDPVEFEILRLTAGECAARERLIVGASLLVLSCVNLAAAAIVPLGSATWGLLGIGGVVAGAGWLAMIAGMRRLHLTLNPRQERSGRRLRAAPHRFRASPTASLPSRSMPASVTEDSTRPIRTDQDATAKTADPRRRETAP